MGQKLVKILAKNQSKVEWIGTRATCKDVVADSQQKQKAKEAHNKLEKRGCSVSSAMFFFLGGS